MEAEEEDRVAFAVAACYYVCYGCHNIFRRFYQDMVCGRVNDDTTVIKEYHNLKEKAIILVSKFLVEIVYLNIYNIIIF